MRHILKLSKELRRKLCNYMYRLLPNDFSLKIYAKLQLLVAVYDLSNFNVLASRT